jgi:hypothetical protein
MGGRGRLRRVDHTVGWEQIELLCAWPEQARYESIRPLVLFGDSVVKRAKETRVAERTLYRRVSSFEAEGMESLFDTEKAKRRALPLRTRRMIVDLKAEHPPMDLGELSASAWFWYLPSKP